MQARTVLDQIEVRGDGTIFVRLMKQVLADDGRVLASEPHRAALTPLADAAVQKAAIDAHLAQMGYPPLAEAGWQGVLAQAAVKWTPDIVAAWQARAAEQPA